MDLEKGEMVLLDLSTPTEDGWYFAQRRGNVGMIPSNYVRVIRDRSSKFPPASILFWGLLTSLHTSAASFFHFLVEGIAGLAEMDDLPSSTSLAEIDEPPPRTLVPATCLHDFTGEGEGDISVKRNDIIKVDGEQLSKREEWLYAELSDGVSGYIPISYVKRGVHGKKKSFHLPLFGIFDVSFSP